MEAVENTQETIIIVDDDITNLTVAKNNLAGRYNVLTAPSGKKLFLLLEKVTPDLILLDIGMPEMDGYAVMQHLKSMPETARIPVIFLTARSDPESEAKGLSLGAVDYITMPFSKELLIQRIDLHILLGKQQKELLDYSHDLESMVEKKTKTVFELQNAILRIVADLVERRDNVTGGHIERTQQYLSMLVDFLLEHGVYARELSSWDIGLFLMSSQLHDVGKISIKDSILMKQGRLTDEEFEEMKKHTIFGVDIIRRIERSTTENAFLEHAALLAGSHHEKWDGTGYPYGLKGVEIPLQGRLMAIVDVYDALTNDRPYKKAFTHEAATEIIQKASGTFFDPLIDDVFIMHANEFKHFALDKDFISDAHISLYDEGKLPSALKVVADIVDIRDSSGYGHTERMRQYVDILINALMRHERYKEEVAAWDRDLFLMSASLHDVGKIGVADRILNKKGKLTEEEFEEIKAHVDFGVRIIRQVAEDAHSGALLPHVEAAVGSHHEKWDGTGYPLGLKGQGIPLEGRLMAIVDVYDALTTDRPYRDMLTHNDAVEIIKSCSGTHFDSELVDIFLECEKEFERAARVG